MALINPVQTLFVPFLLILMLPLAVFAGITTTLAFSILSFRVVAVYLDMALSLVPQCFSSSASDANSASANSHHHSHRRHLSLSPATSSSSTQSLENSPTTPTHPHLLHLHLHQAQSVPRRRPRRPSSLTSVVSAGSVTTPGGEMAMGLMPSVGPERDFEGVGGWREDRDGDDDTWTTINSRFELPDRIHARNHHRSPSGGPVTPGDTGVLMMKGRARSPAISPSPNSSRARTPSVSRTMTASDGYFSLTMSPTTIKKPLMM
ncbi:hypothetical protein L249_4273 [Ophiocordyceps polyrhachis-furcata BCC 54312]|uniref:Uncharacterized protein n=1 Tax=Ophiocordyceps polyrhachis-furcata BCC 54312 TaxID=1330021 RepID=A0A367L7P5_9HYPO|nr:hypothetical protein L249_4273 [Ophiocordyceps polyrhachis-furcata BCC 54312]